MSLLQLHRVVRLPQRGLSWLGGYHGIPYLSRHSFRYEWRAALAFSVAAAAIEPGFLQFFAKKTLGASYGSVAVLAAANTIGMFTGGLSAALLTSRRQVPILSGCLLLTAGLLAATALLPASPISAYGFAAIMLLVAMLNTTVTNAKTSILQANYPDTHRGQVYSRLIILGTLAVATLVQLQSAALDRWEGFHHVLFLLAGGSAAATALIYARVRMRGEQARLRRRGTQRVSVNPLLVLEVLRRDRPFARYMGWQMLMGSASMLLETGVLAIILDERFGASYSSAAVALVVAPTAIRIVATPLVGRLFDRVNFMKFRSAGAALWGLGRLVVFLGAWQVSMPLLIVGRVVTGLGATFGGFGWNLGHLKFARPGESPLYMGAHMLLTAMRGCTMPFIGVLLYSEQALGTDLGLGLGVHMIWITALMHLTAAAGLYRMHAQVPTAVTPDRP